MEIQKKLARFPVPEFVWDEYHLDQEINDRGIRVDMQMVENAIDVDGWSRFDLKTQLQDLTALENPNSVAQMKAWLTQHGMEIESLGKKEVAAMLKDAPPDMREALVLRQQLAKSSVKKYQVLSLIHI